MTLSSILFAALLLSGGTQSASTQPASAKTGPDTVAEFQALCVETRGDRAAIETAALARGYVSAPAGSKDRFYSEVADPPVAVWTRGEGDAGVRVVSAPTQVRDDDAPWASTNQCFITGPGRFRDARAALIDATGVDPFLYQRGSAFLWVEGPDGRESLSQRQYRDHLAGLMRERDAQAIRVFGSRQDASIVRAADDRAGVILIYEAARP